MKRGYYSNPSQHKPDRSLSTNQPPTAARHHMGCNGAESSVGGNQRTDPRASPRVAHRSPTERLISQGKEGLPESLPKCPTQSPFLPNGVNGTQKRDRTRHFYPGLVTKPDQVGGVTATRNRPAPPARHQTPHAPATYSSPPVTPREWCNRVQPTQRGPLPKRRPAVAGGGPVATRCDQVQREERATPEQPNRFSPVSETLPRDRPQKSLWRGAKTRKGCLRA